MKADSLSVGKILHDTAQYAIPLFQRSYSWHKEHWRRLYEDINALFEDSQRHQHFLGPLVSTQGSAAPGELTTFQLIDGQQRLTTLTIILVAIRDLAREHELPELSEEITEDYLIHKRRPGMEKYKLLPRLGDRDALIAMVEGNDLSAYSQLRIIHAWKYFKRQIRHLIRRNPGQDLHTLKDIVLHKLQLVVITIDGENPYEIFESLNATGLALAESDLIRNYVFMQVPLEEQANFDSEYWQPLEAMFAEWGNDRSSVMTTFYRDYLMRDGVYSRDKSTFIDFKHHNSVRELTPSDQAKELIQYAPLAIQIRKPATCKNLKIRNHLLHLYQMDIGTSNALVLHLLNRHAGGAMAEDVLCGCLRDLVSFTLRRTICGDSTRPYGRWFVEAIISLKDDPANNLRSYFLQRGWPSDEAFIHALSDFQLYKRESQKTLMMLTALEASFKHKEAVQLENLTLEHVMPQTVANDAAGKAWKSALGDDWKDVHEQFVHVLGNLTLTGYNPELGNISFTDKRRYYDDSKLSINRYFHQLDQWNAHAIRERTEKLGKLLCDVWPHPEPGKSTAYDSAETPVPAQLSSARKRNLHYWSLLIKQWPDDLGLAPPAPSDSAELVVPLNEQLDVSIRLWQFRRERKQVAYVRFHGQQARKLYDALRERKEEIDDAIAGDLEWDWPVRNSFSVSEEDADYSDQHDWEIQHAWFLEELTDIVAVLKPEIETFDFSKDSELHDSAGERHSLRQEFWTQLLSHAKTRTDLHANRNPGKYNWIGGGIGRSGFHLNYGVREHDSTVELYIDRKDKKINRTIFQLLYSMREAIEAEFGDSIDWQELPESRASRICKVINGGWRSLPTSWPDTHREMVDAMIRLDNAFRDRVHSMKISE